MMSAYILLQISLIHVGQTYVCSNEEDVFNNTCNRVHCIVVLQQKVARRNKKLIISGNTLYCFNITNNVCNKL